jgi:hypothetical protein
VTEYLCLTLIAEPGEAESAFKSRLTAFWTHLIRTRKQTYEAVYAEATRFGATDGRVSRQYMVEASVAAEVASELSASGIATAPLEADDTYSKYEAAPPDWFQIPH